MPTLRSKTVQNENQMVDFLEQNNIPGLVGSPDYTVNSSGFLTVICNDATQDRATTAVFDGTPDAANFGAALTATDYSTAINVANASKLVIGIEVAASSSSALHLNLRLSNLGAPDLTDATHWFRQLAIPAYSSSKYDADVAEYQIKSGLLSTGAKYKLEIPVTANWANIVLHNAHSSSSFKIYVDVA